MPAPAKKSGSHEVGYGKPPAHTRFRKGQSGNPGGRPADRPVGRLKDLVLKEAYRTVTTTGRDGTTKLSAIELVLRSQIALAASGNGAAQRALIADVLAVEQEIDAQQAARKTARGAGKSMDYAEAARRVCLLLDLSYEGEMANRATEEAVRAAQARGARVDPSLLPSFDDATADAAAPPEDR